MENESLKTVQPIRGDEPGQYSVFDQDKGGYGYFKNGRPKSPSRLASWKGLCVSKH